MPDRLLALVEAGPAAAPLRNVRREPGVIVLAVAALAWGVVVTLHLPAWHSLVQPWRTRPLTGGAVALADWLVMTVAMMLPITVPAVRHVAQNSLRRRRTAAVVELLTGYLAVWTLFGVLALATLAAATQMVTHPVALAVALALAAGWQVSPWIGRFRRQCHRTVPLPPSGRAAVLGAVRFGLRHGVACVGVCWPLMLASAVVLHRGVLWMVALAGLVIGQRLVPQPRRAARPAEAVLAAAALVALFVGSQSADGSRPSANAVSWFCSI